MIKKALFILFLFVAISTTKATPFYTSIKSDIIEYVSTFSNYNNIQHHKEEVVEENNQTHTVPQNIIAMYANAINQGVDYIDVEISFPIINQIKKLINVKKTKLIISYHNFKETNKRDINQKYNLIQKHNPNIIKIGVNPKQKVKVLFVIFFFSLRP